MRFEIAVICLGFHFGFSDGKLSLLDNSASFVRISPPPPKQCAWTGLSELSGAFKEGKVMTQVNLEAEGEHPGTASLFHPPALFVELPG